ncbi:MAG: hypothetical protein ACE5E4_03660 [Candidatus Binatia bacterium]
MSETANSKSSERKSRTVCVEDPALTMVEPDTVSPAQFFNHPLEESSLVPEKRLMLAVLEDAIASFQRNVFQASADAESDDSGIEEWLESDDKSWAFSFASICQALNMEPEYLRRGLRGWRDRAAEQGVAGRVYRFPFRRVNGRRHSINAKRERRRVRKAS